MKSAIAAEVRRERIKKDLSMTSAERVELALRLGQQEIEDEMARSGISREEALRKFSATRAIGRRPSCANR